jgi:hypothetical protein
MAKPFKHNEDPIFNLFREQMQKQLDACMHLSGGRLYYVELPKWLPREGQPHKTVDLFDTFLANLPEDVRQQHNCNRCRRFVKKYGHIVGLLPTGELIPAIWPSMQTLKEASADLERYKGSDVIASFLKDSQILKPVYSTKAVWNGRGLKDNRIDEHCFHVTPLELNLDWLVLGPDHDPNVPKQIAAAEQEWRAQVHAWFVHISTPLPVLTKYISYLETHPDDPAFDDLFFYQKLKAVKIGMQMVTRAAQFSRVSIAALNALSIAYSPLAFKPIPATWKEPGWPVKLLE